jgi:membrane-bound lytic murein transglycosylase B
MFLKTIAIMIICFVPLLGQGKSTVARGSLSTTEFLEKRLRSNGFPKKFIQLLVKNYDASKRDQIIKLNVMGFLLSPDYTGHVSANGEQRCKEFLREHSAPFAAAEKQYGVKKELIASLLWVESRLGDNHGNFHVASVYLSLLLGDHPQVAQMLQEDLRSKVDKVTRSLVLKTKERAKTKGRWAIGELWALYKINKLAPKTLERLRGSYSGAFGFAQFLPSSYVQWAKSFAKKTTPDLYEPGDAIMSVAYYLKKNGYRQGKEASYKKALFHYNRSRDYGTTILKLASNL